MPRISSRKARHDSLSATDAYMFSASQSAA